MQTNRLKSITAALALGLVLAMANGLRADTFGSGGNTFTIDFVTVGNAGNGDDVNNPHPNPGDGGTPYGGVGYTYRMGVYEISQDQITKATSGGLANVTAGAWTGSQPAADMSWYECAAFVNWLNDQRTPGLKAYDLTWTGSGWTMALWDSGNAWQADGENLYRHKDAYYFLPGEDEWYKAAYHKNDGVTASYWDYAIGSDAPPVAVASGTAAGTAVYDGVGGFPAAVEGAGGPSPYGTIGQNGNLWEWCESAVDATNDSSSESRTLRGGIWAAGEDLLRSSNAGIADPLSSLSSFGFRVASVPEPSAVLLMASGFGAWLLRRRRNS